MFNSLKDRKQVFSFLRKHAINFAFAAGLLVTIAFTSANYGMNFLAMLFIAYVFSDPSPNSGEKLSLKAQWTALCLLGGIVLILFGQGLVWELYVEKQLNLLVLPFPATLKEVADYGSTILLMVCFFHIVGYFFKRRGAS